MRSPMDLDLYFSARRVDGEPELRNGHCTGCRQIRGDSINVDFQPSAGWADHHFERSAGNDPALEVRNMQILASQPARESSRVLVSTANAPAIYGAIDICPSRSEATATRVDSLRERKYLIEQITKCWI